MRHGLGVRGFYCPGLVILDDRPGWHQVNHGGKQLQCNFILLRVLTSLEVCMYRFLHRLEYPRCSPWESICIFWKLEVPGTAAWPLNVSWLPSQLAYTSLMPETPQQTRAL